MQGVLLQIYLWRSVEAHPEHRAWVRIAGAVTPINKSGVSLLDWEVGGLRAPVNILAPIVRPLARAHSPAGPPPGWDGPPASDWDNSREMWM